MFGKSKNKKIKELEKLVDDMQDLCEKSLRLQTDFLTDYVKMRNKYARFFAMIERGIPFLVVKWEEPYAHTVFNMIRDNEIRAERWAETDQKVYEIFCKYKGISEKGDLEC